MHAEQLTPRIIPAIPAQDREALEKGIASLCGAAALVQIDIADGTFSPSTTWLPAEGELLPEISGVSYELHLMVREPERCMHLVAQESVQRAIVHIESFADHDALYAYIEAVHLLGKECGVAFLLKTDIAAHLSVLKAVDVVQLMSIAEVGHHGEPFEPCVEERIALVRTAYEGPLALDGGITKDTIPYLRSLSVQRFGIGSAILKAPQPPLAFRECEAQLHEEYEPHT